MPSPFVWEGDEDQYDPETGSYRPMPKPAGRAVVSFSTPRRVMSESYDQLGGLGEQYDPETGSYRPMPSEPTPELPTPSGARLFDPEEGPRDEPGFSPVSKPRTALEDLSAHQGSMPQRQAPKWWQRLAAGALGGAAGYLNAGGRNRIDVEPAIAGIYDGGYNREMGNWQNEQAGLATRAKIEAEQADDARKQLESTARIGQYEAATARSNRPFAPRNPPVVIPGRDVPLSPEVEEQRNRMRPPQRPIPQIPGRDVPLPPDVEDQRVRMRPPQRGPAGGKVTVTDKKFDIAQGANQAISEHPELDLSIIKENVMNPRYFTDWEPQKRADVSLEIQRRMDDKAKAKPTGLLGRGKADPAKGGSAAPNANAGPLNVKLKHPQTGEVKRFMLTPQEFQEAKSKGFSQVE
jgi:hypothetical protein